MRTEATVVVNLQKSDWDDTYYVNFGVWLNSPGDETLHEQHLCPIGARVERLFPEDRELILTSCSLNDSNRDLLAELTEFMGAKLVPFCIECTQIGALRSYLLQGRFDHGLVTKAVRDLLTGP